VGYGPYSARSSVGRNARRPFPGVAVGGVERMQERGVVRAIRNETPEALCRAVSGFGVPLPLPSSNSQMRRGLLCTARRASCTLSLDVAHFKSGSVN